ncbi:hypothetical protein TheetDRAFT_2878 [Thermoanaerobacter ethanolicus JW 200]|nr:hypothetical protein TheetDRAFT_2878 [Thermoanaerobacter ethanolicus JW 200]
MLLCPFYTHSERILSSIGYDFRRNTLIQKVTLFHQIQRAITELYYSQKITPVIILDEIRLVSNDVLEDLRIIFNFNMDSQNPYILILSGQPHIRNKLALNVNSALRQRISIKYVMQGLKKKKFKII